MSGVDLYSEVHRAGSRSPGEPLGKVLIALTGRLDVDEPDDPSDTEAASRADTICERLARVGVTYVV